MLQDKMGVNNSSLTLLNCILKNWDKFDPQGLRHIWSSYVILHGHSTHWRTANSGQLEGLWSIITVLQLDRFCREQGKWVEVAYVLLFFSLWNMPDLCPKGIDWGVTPSAPSCPSTLLDEMEDRRQRDKEKQVSPIYPWDHMRTPARETEEQPHTLLPLNESPTGRNNHSMRVT